MKLYISNIPNYVKPNIDKIKQISSTILEHPVDVTPQDLASELCFKGKTVMLANIGNEKLSKSTPIISQEVIMLDFDNKDEDNIYNISDLLEDDFMQENACFYYKTFSSGMIDKFRVVFILNDIATKNYEIENIYSELLNRYPQADTTVAQTTRLFFGTVSGFKVVNWENKLDIDSISEYNQLIISSKDLEISEETPVYKLLQYRKYKLARDRFHKLYGDSFKNTFHDDHSASAYFRDLDIQDLLELPRGNPFLDVFHLEEEPSASVFYSDEHNTYLYKCFSESNPFTGDIFQVIIKLTNVASRVRAINLLVNLTGGEINFNSDFGMAKRDIEEFRKSLMTGSLKNNYPELYSYLDRYRIEIVHTLDLMFDFTYHDRTSGEIRYLNYFSFETLRQKVSYTMGKKISVSKMWTVLNTIVVTEMIRKLPSESIPSEIYDNLINVQKTNEHKIRTSNIYEPQSFDKEAIKNMSEIAKVLKENNVTSSSFSFELIYRLFGEDKAKQDFPQAYKPLEEKGLIKMSKIDNNLTKKSISLENKALSIIIESIENNGYILEDTLIKKLSRKNKTGYENTKKLYNKIRADLMNKYNLDRKRMTKSIHSELKVIEKYSSKVIIYKKKC